MTTQAWKPATTRLRFAFCQASSLRGFCAGIDSDLLDIIEPVEIVTALNTVEGFADTTETTLDKFFLPSLQEMYINPQLAGVEGVDWDYYKDLAEEAGLTGKFAQYGTYPILITYQAGNTTNPVTVWLRSCYTGYAASAWHVSGAGYVSVSNACHAYRGCPACKILAS